MGGSNNIFERVALLVICIYLPYCFAIAFCRSVFVNNSSTVNNNEVPKIETLVHFPVFLYIVAFLISSS